MLAVRGGDPESVTVAVKPAVPSKLAVPESTPVEGSIVSPVTNSAVEEMGAIDQLSVPVPFTACSVWL